MNRLGKLDLFVGKIVFTVLGQLARKNQHAVERGAQFVRHVGDKFRFVPGGQSQLLGLLFHLPARFFYLAVLGFDFCLLPRQERRLVLQLFVGLLQLFLLALQQLFGLAQRLGLLLELFVRFLQLVLLALQLGRE